MNGRVATEYLQAEADLKAAKDRIVKAARTRDVGEPIELKGKVIQMIIRGDDVWTAESGAVARRIDLNTGRTKQLYKGHGGPVTCIAFYERGDGAAPLLITGAWDKTIKVWNTITKELVSTTLAHEDFLKSFVVIPSLKLLASGSSDKTVKLWDLSVLDGIAPKLPLNTGPALPQVGSFTGHRRPIDCLAVDLTPPASSRANGATLLYSGDSMGVIKAWSFDITLRADGSRLARGTSEAEFLGHRTGVCSMIVADGAIWSGSSDSNLLLQSSSPSSSSTNPTNEEGKTAVIPTIPHPSPIRALLPLSLTPLERPILITGSADLLTAWDVSSFGEPGAGEVEVISKIDAHSHDITGLGLWVRRMERETEHGTKLVYKEAWIVSASLDGTLRRWKLDDIVNRKYEKEIQKTLAREQEPVPAAGQGMTLSAEEEAELAALMGDDDD